MNRILVGLPSVENREKILKTLLGKENIEEWLNFSELAIMTEGFTGSDLKNLCTTAAYRPLRELIQQERLKDIEKKRRAESGEEPESLEENRMEKVITIRPLKMEDFRDAKNQEALYEQILEGVWKVQMPPIPRHVQLYVDMEPIVFFTGSS